MEFLDRLKVWLVTSEVKEYAVNGKIIRLYLPSIPVSCQRRPDDGVFLVFPLPSGTRIIKSEIKRGKISRDDAIELNRQYCKSILLRRCSTCPSLFKHYCEAVVLDRSRENDTPVALADISGDFSKGLEISQVVAAFRALGAKCME